MEVVLSVVPQRAAGADPIEGPGSGARGSTGTAESWCHNPPAGAIANATWSRPAAAVIRARARRLSAWMSEASAGAGATNWTLRDWVDGVTVTQAGSEKTLSRPRVEAAVTTYPNRAAGSPTSLKEGDSRPLAARAKAPVAGSSRYTLNVEVGAIPRCDEGVPDAHLSSTEPACNVAVSVDGATGRSDAGADWSSGAGGEIGITRAVATADGAPVATPERASTR